MPDSANQLCLQCGLCCNGVIFANGQLKTGDDAARLRELGLKLRAAGVGMPKFRQPCAAFDGCRCGIYNERPRYCREFDCALLQQVRSGRLANERAQQIVSQTLRQARRVTVLLAKLGSADIHSPLHHRFRAVSRQMERSGASADEGELFADLSAAVHRLNLTLAQRFYPGA